MNNRMTHHEARELLQIAVDAPLSSEDRRALDAHVAGCGTCAAYAADLARLDAHLFESLRARWADPQQSSLQLDRDLRHFEARVRQRHIRQRLMAVAQPAVWALGALTLVAVMAWLLGSAVQNPGGEDGTPTATDEIAETPTSPGEITNTPQASQESAGTACLATMIPRQGVNARGGPGANYDVVDSLKAGTVVEVTGVFYEPDQTAWLQFVMENSNFGWVGAEYARAEGDCGSVPVLSQASPPGGTTPVPTDGANGQTAIPGVPTPTPSPTLDSDVCYVAPSDYSLVNLNVYSGPGTMYGVIGALEIGEWVVGTGQFYEENYNTWVRIVYGDGKGWVEGIYYMFGDGCFDLPLIPMDSPPPTFTPVGTPYTPTPLPTPDAIPTEINYTYAIDGTPGTVQSFSNPLPDGQGGMSQNIRVRVTGLPQGSGAENWRRVTLQMACEGTNPQYMRWGYYNSISLAYVCGTIIDGVVSYGYSDMYFIFAVPPNGESSVTYTLTVTVSEYRP